MTDLHLSVKLTPPAAGRLTDTEMAGSLVNQGSLAIDVALPSGSFPFEVELLDQVGIDVLAKYRSPRDTRRRTGNPVQTVHLEPGGKRTFKATIREYIDSKGFPADDAEDAVKLRLYAAASVDQARRFSVVRSDAVDLPPTKK